MASRDALPVYVCFKCMQSGHHSWDCSRLCESLSVLLHRPETLLPLLLFVPAPSIMVCCICIFIISEEMHKRSKAEQI